MAEPALSFAPAPAAKNAQTATATAASGTFLLGERAVETTRDGGTGTSEAFGYTASVSGTAAGINVYLASTDGVSVGLYADSSAKPGALLDRGTVSSNTAGWVEVSLSKGVQINQGTRYWLAIAAKNSSSTVSYYDDGSSGSNFDYSGSGLANPFSITGQWNSHPASVYLTGTPSSPTAPSSTSPPKISGAPQQGATLTASNGTWTGTTPITYSYQWQDNGKNISGATARTYVPTTSDVGHTIDVIVTAKNSVGSASATSAATATVQKSGSSGMYALPADRTYAWNPGLNAVGGIPDRTTIYKTISPSGGDDTAAIQAALNSCPKNGVVQLTAGVFHISGQGLSIENSYCTLRGAGPGPGNWPTGTPASGTGGTYLEKSPGTGYPVVIIGPRWTGAANDVNLTSDAVRGTNTVTVASASGITAGDLVTINELTDPNISHWNSQDPENNSGWFEWPNRPLGETMEVASVHGNTLTFTTDFPITYQVSQSAELGTLQNQVEYSGIEDLYTYGGEGGDGGGGIHLFNCGYCWVKHVEDTYNVGSAVSIDNGFRDEIRDSYIHDSEDGYTIGGSSYGVALNWYTSDTLVENNIIMRFDKVDVMRSAGGGNVFGYNYLDDGCDGCNFMEDNLNSSHMTTPHYELFEGNQAPNFDEDDRWGNSDYITVFRNQFTGQLRDFPGVGPFRAIGVTQWHWNQSFVGNVLGTASDTSIFNNGYESIGGSWANAEWVLCYQASDDVPDRGKCLSTLLRDGNYDYLTREVHWYGIGGTGVDNGLTPPAHSTLPASLYLSAKPAFFGSNPWPWVNGSSAANPLPGRLPARERYDAGTPNAEN